MTIICNSSRYQQSYPREGHLKFEELRKTSKSTNNHSHRSQIIIKFTALQIRDMPLGQLSSIPIVVKIVRSRNCAQRKQKRLINLRKGGVRPNSTSSNSSSWPMDSNNRIICQMKWMGLTTKPLTARARLDSPTIKVTKTSTSFKTQFIRVHSQLINKTHQIFTVIRTTFTPKVCLCRRGTSIKGSILWHRWAQVPSN